MANLTIDDVKKLARLARLKLSDDELARYSKEFTALLNYFEILNQADTDGLKPTYQVTGLSNVMRPDEEIDYGTDRAGLLSNVPQHDNQHIRVNRMVG